jgi:hypothetical protein
MNSDDDQPDGTQPSNGSTEDTQNDTPADQSDRSTDRTTQPKNDVWEEEIDLREVGRGIINKWYVWLIIPFLISLTVGAYYVFTPQTYRLTAQFTVERNNQQLNMVDVNIPPQSVLISRFRSVETAERLLSKYYPNSGSLETISLNFVSDIEIETSTDSGIEAYELEYETSRPDSAARIVEGLMTDFKRRVNDDLATRLKDREEYFRHRRSILNQRWANWRKEWSRFLADTIPRLVAPKLENAEKNYQSAVKEMSTLERKIAVKQATLKDLNKLLENEPVTFDYKVPYLPMTGTVSKRGSNSTVEAKAINDAYQQLRTMRVKTSSKLASLKEERMSLRRMLEDSSQTIRSLERTLPELRQRNQALEEERDYFQDALTTANKKLTALNFLINSPPQLIELYPPSGVNEPISQNAARNTVLSGAVTFLLLFFGVAFWEIL